MDLRTQTPCDLCLGIIRHITDPSGPHWQAQQLEWHQDIHQLQSSAQSCPLCSSLLDLSLTESYSMAMTRLEGAALRSPPLLELEVASAKKAEKITWAILRTTLNVEQLGMSYIRVDTIGVSSQPEREGLEHPKFWVFNKIDEKKTDSEDRIETMVEWLRDCESNHEGCNPPAKRYPKRLLDVGVNESLRIVEGNQIQQDNQPIRYATLSHCWGHHVPMRTTIKTKPQFEKDISEELLPRTYRDAIRITRSLGIRYLWIDSLCIVQDDPEDWQSEALRMEDTFFGSTINIAASDALDGAGGCFLERNGDTGATPATSSDPGRTVVVETSGLAAESHRVFVYQHEDQLLTTMIRVQARTARNVQGGAHLSTRGWVLQEELLSHRIIHCMQSEMHWQCRCFYKTQAGQTLESSELMGGDRNLTLAPSQREKRIWHEWIERYSNRDFTFPADRFAAIAGIAGYYQQRTRHSPLLGLWKESFVGDLLWLRIGSTKGSGIHRMPSWTWLSCNAPVLFDFWRLSDEDLETREDHVLLLTCNNTWNGLDMASSAQAAFLVIKGHLKDLRFRIAQESKSNPPYFHLEGEVLDSSLPMPWSSMGQFDDGTIPRDAFATYTCLLVRSRFDDQSGFHRETFLILESVARSLDETGNGLLCFRRIGIGSIGSKEKTFILGEEKEMRLY